jgi:hypothetical protein
MMAGAYQSDRFVRLGGHIGEPFKAHVSVLEHYLLPSLRACATNWDPLKGAQNSRGDIFDYELGYVARKQAPDARIELREGVHVVAVYHSVVFTLLEYFHRLFADPAFLPDIGDPALGPSLARREFSAAPGHAIAAGEAEISHVDDIAAVMGHPCPERRAAATQLFHLAMQFVWEHEMAHAVLGHVLFARDRQGMDELGRADIRHAIDSDSGDGIWSFLESQADAGAAFSLIVGPMIRLTKRRYMIISSDDAELARDVRFRFLSAALLNHFLMLWDVGDLGGNPEAVEVSGDHPSTLSRAIAALLRSGQDLAHNPDYEAAWILLERGRKKASEDLLAYAVENGLFRPFRWLLRSDTVDRVFAEAIALDTTDIRAAIAPHAFRKAPCAPTGT